MNEMFVDKMSVDEISIIKKTVEWSLDEMSKEKIFVDLDKIFLVKINIDGISIDKKSLD